MSLTRPPQFAEKDLNYYLRMIRADFSELEEPLLAESCSKPSQDALVLIDKPFLGDDDSLGEELMLGMIAALAHCHKRPAALIFMHQAVCLCRCGSPVESDLKYMAHLGIPLIICESSARDYELWNQHNTAADNEGECGWAVGHCESLQNICERLMNAKKVIKL